MKVAIVATLGLFAATLFGAASPKEVCDSLAKAARDDNFKSFASLTLSPATAKEKGFHKMHKDKMAQLKDLTCGSETVAGTHAFVEATSQNGKRLIPFVESEGAWKFDIGTYKEFYRHAQK